jgi:hypothetical protein
VDALAAGGRLARVDSAAVTTLVARLRLMSQHLREAADGLAVLATAGVLVGWTGPGHEEFAAAAAAARARLVALGDALDVAASALSSVEAALVEAQGEVRAAARVLAVAGSTDPVREVASELAGALAAYEEADARAAFLLGDCLLLDLSRTHALPPRAVPATAAKALARDVSLPRSVPAGPAATTVWWAGLTDAERATFTSGWTGWVASADGIPAGVRDAVNRSRLADAVRDAEQVYAQAPLYATYAHEVARTRLLRLKALASAVAVPASQLLLFDPRGDGEAVVATADVETSRSVAVVVPGMNSDLADAPALIDETRRLAAAAGPGTAVIMWLGYDAPDVHQVVSDGAAKSGAGALQRFVAGLRATAALPQHLTVLGHSYGSLVAGLAAKRGLAADDLVLLASPGVEAAHASQLRLPDGHVWAARVPTDPIQLVFWPPIAGRLLGVELPPVFGPDPASAGFGARHFPAGGAAGHSGYFATGTQSLASLGRIVSGRPLP